MSATFDWLSRRSDAQLTDLLSARPDLLSPTPGSFAVLARRLDLPSSTHRALARLDRFAMQILYALAALDAVPAAPGTAGASGERGASAAEVAALLGGPATIDDVSHGLRRLDALALAHRTGEPDRPRYVLATATTQALGRYPGGLGPATGIAADRLAAGLAEAEAARPLLERLAAGPPVGAMDASASQRAAVERLVELGLLTRQDGRTVVLPREVGLALRGPHPFGAADPVAPALVTTRHPAGTVDGAAGVAALAAHRRCVTLLRRLGEEPQPGLKSGGIGIQALRRLAASAEIEVTQAALYLETLAAAGLLAAETPRYGVAGRGAPAAQRWMPTTTADRFLAGDVAAGWALLAGAWLTMSRAPAQVGKRTPAGSLRNVLTEDLHWPGAATWRLRVLGELAGLAAGTAASADSLAARIGHASPLRSADQVAAVVADVLAAAEEWGVVAFGALSAPGRALVADESPLPSIPSIPSIAGADSAVGAADAPGTDGAAANTSTDTATSAPQGVSPAAAMTTALPPVVDEFLVQADFTVVVPGRLSPDLSARLDAIADVESAGGALVYRIGPDSLRRAFDAGAGAAEVHALLERHSATPIPQALTFTIDDVSRRHGRLRAGGAGCYLRADDPALVSAAAAAAERAGVPLKVLAPTVAVSPVDVETVTAALRAAGVALAAEDFGGTVQDVRSAPYRTRATAPSRPQVAAASAPSAAQVAAAVARIRAGSATVAGAQEAADIVAVLKAAAAAGTSAWISYADAEGQSAHRQVDPLTVSGGVMVAFDRLRDAPRTFTLHRIRAASPA